MKQMFNARIWQEGDVFIAQCVEIDVASHGQNVQQALELHFEPPTATILPRL